MRVQRLAPDHLPQQFSLFSPQRVSPFVRTRTTTDRQTSLLAGSDGHVLGVRFEAYLRARCHRTPRPRGTLAWRTAGGSGTLCRTRQNLLEVVVLGLITCEVVKGVHLLSGEVRSVTAALKVVEEKCRRKCKRSRMNEKMRK